MQKIKLFTGEYIDKEYFEDTLSALEKEQWIKKPISDLVWEHINCMLSFETISGKTSDFFYESEQGNIVSVRAYDEYIKPNLK